MLCLSSKALYPWTTQNRLVWGLHVRFSENFFETQGQNARIYNNCWTTKLFSSWGPDFFAYPQFQKSKNTRLLSHEHLTKKLRNCFFCHQKWGVDLYTRLTYTRVNTVIFALIPARKQGEWHKFRTIFIHWVIRFTCKCILYKACLYIHVYSFQAHC